MSDLTEEDFKVAIVNMLKEWKGSMIEEIKEGMKTIVHQVENVRKEMEIIKKRPKWNFYSWKVQYLKCNLYMTVQINVI